MATDHKSTEIKRVLALWENTRIPPFKCSEATVLFYQLALLIAFVFGHISITDVYHLMIPGKRLEELLEKDIHDLPQVRVIEVYYETDEDLERARRRFQQYTKLRLCHVHNLPGRLQRQIVDQAISRPGSIDRTALRNTVSLITERLMAKRAMIATPISSIPQPPCSGFDAKNKHEIDQKYLCSLCKLIFRDPVQLICGHRQCQSRVCIQNIIVTCSICNADTLREHVWIDRGFRNEMQDLSILCSVCNWTGSLKLYQKHIDRNHSNHLTMVESNALINCFVCIEQIVRNKIREHYSNATHRNRFIDWIRNLCSRPSTYPSDREHRIRSSQFSDTISVLSNTTESNRQRNSIQNINQTPQEVRRSNDESDAFRASMQFIQTITEQNLESLRRDQEETSYDGTYIWKIIGVHDKMIDAQSERQQSIYSPSFYSSYYGFKMCMRLFLNGDKHAYETHMSIFLVMMRGEFDDFLNWPFKFKVTFQLLDQLATDNNRQHIMAFFWPDSTSSSFRQPFSSMNIASGIPEFVSLSVLEEKGHRYIPNDTMFIKIEVDLITPPPANLLGTYCTMVDDTRKQATDDDDIIAKLC